MGRHRPGRPANIVPIVTPILRSLEIPTNRALQFLLTILGLQFQDIVLVDGDGLGRYDGVGVGVSVVILGARRRAGQQ